MGAAKACLVGNQKSYQQNSFRHACSGRLMRLVRLLRAYPGTSSARKHYCALTSKSCFRGKIRKSCQQSSCRHTLQRDQASGEAASSLPWTSSAWTLLRHPVLMKNEATWSVRALNKLSLRLSSKDSHLRVHADAMLILDSSWPKPLFLLLHWYF